MRVVVRHLLSLLGMFVLGSVAGGAAACVWAGACLYDEHSK